MVENKKEHGFMSMIKEGLGHISKIISASIFPSIAEGAEMVMKTVEERIVRIVEEKLIRMEKRLLKRISSLLIIGFGTVFLILALLFFLIEFLGWSKAVAFFSIGIIVFVTGLLLKVGEHDN